MLTPTLTLLDDARAGGYAIGAFNVYNLEGVKAVVAAAEQQRSPAMLQLHPGALAYGGPPLVALCLRAAAHASVPVSVHLDHSPDADAIRAALADGLRSVMADGSQGPYAENVAFTAAMAALAHAQGGVVEAELGRLSGSEDDLSVPEREARLTDPAQAAAFVAATGVDMLAVCIGNVHGRYARPPQLDFARLGAIRRAVPLPLVLHGASGLPDDAVQRAIELGVCKFNVNTELREAYVAALRATTDDDVLPLMRAAVAAMQRVVAARLHLFGATGRA